MAHRALFGAGAVADVIVMVFSGVHLAVLGYLAYTSGQFPRLLGVAMLVGSLGYFFEGLRRVTFFDNTALAMIVVGLLLISGVCRASPSA